MARRDAGFSLVEVLTAMFIAALAAVAVVAVMPPPKPDVQKTAERLSAALVRAQRASVIQGAPVGLIVAPDGWRFAAWDGAAWRDLDRAGGLGPGVWPDGALVSVESEAVSGDEDLPDDFPAAVFDATGGADPFALRLDGRDGRARIVVDAAGAVTVETPDA